MWLSCDVYIMSAVERKPTVHPLRTDKRPVLGGGTRTNDTLQSRQSALYQLSYIYTWAAQQQDSVLYLQGLW